MHKNDLLNQIQASATHVATTAHRGLLGHAVAYGFSRDGDPESATYLRDGVGMASHYLEVAGAGMMLFFADSPPAELRAHSERGSLLSPDDIAGLLVKHLHAAGPHAEHDLLVWEIWSVIVPHTHPVPAILARAIWLSPLD